MIRFSSIKLPADSGECNAYRDVNGEQILEISPISRINLFVGSNNSGKSRFLRLIARQNAYEGNSNAVDLSSINAELESIVGGMQKSLRDAGLSKANELDEETLNSLAPFPRALISDKDVYSHYRERFSGWVDFPDITSTSSRASMGLGRVPKEALKQLRDDVRSLSRRALEVLQNVPVTSTDKQPKRVYVPILRGMRHLDTNQQDYYANKTQNDYFTETLNGFSAPETFSGLLFYNRLMQMLLGNNRERRLIAEYQQFVSRTLFEGKPITLIPNQDNNRVVVVKIGNEVELPIHRLGDGIQSSIILSFLPYITEEPTFFFVEEPEMHLHPGLQRKILDFYASLERHMFFMTTHSNHLLDVTIDIPEITVFAFRKKLDEGESDEQSAKFTIEAVDGVNRSSLELLGVRNSSVFLVNATIWVEGITDRWYIRKMLNSYIEQLKTEQGSCFRIEEDVHYSFVEYGGNNITHWSFLEDEEHPIEVDRLCAKAIVIVDGDGMTKAKRKEKLEKELGERLVVLPCREVENLLPPDVIKSVVTMYENTPDRDITTPEYESYRNEYLGRFIDNVLLGNVSARRSKYADDSGTVSQKLDFCKRALPYIEFNSLPLTTQAIVKRIYEFIVLQNQ